MDEHRKHFEKDAALERRFQPVYVDEPTADETLAILHGLGPKYEAYHMCVYPDAVLEAAVALSDRYLPDRRQPDKAIDLLDEAGSRARIAAATSRRSLPPSATAPAQVTALGQVREAMAEAVAGAHFEEAELLLSREREAIAGL